MGLPQAVESLFSVPARIQIEMHANEENVHLARNLVDRAAEVWALPEGVHDDARLILSELAANACRLYLGQVLKVWAGHHPAPRVLELAVWDPDPFEGPKLGIPDYDAETGRGLHIVTELSTRWGWYPSRTTGGKVVWARLVW